MNISRRLSSLAVLASLCAVASTGCADDPGNGTVTVNYDWILGSACAAPFGSGSMQTVSEVRITLTDGNTVVPMTANCIDEEILVSAVPEGNYDVLIEALDATGDTIADNVNVPPDEDEKVKVTGGQGSNVDAEFGPTPATIEVALTVFSADGFPVMCSEADVQFFNVVASGPPIGKLHEEELDFCTQLSGFQPVPDVDRKINGLALDRVRIGVQDSSHAQLQELDFMLGGPVGAGKTVRIKVDCAEIDCMGVLSFPEGGGGDGGEESGGVVEESGGGSSSEGGGSSSGGADSTG